MWHSVDIGNNKAPAQWRAKQVIDAQPRVASPPIPEIVPERVDTLVGMQRTRGVGPALATSRKAPQLGPERRIVGPRVLTFGDKLMIGCDPAFGCGTVDAALSGRLLIR